ncbi:MAG TPA: DUF1326 domain-containing protein [Acidimicrobiales bacterium]|nr:DUF1326 domain-containing protein [Acidimicrobiales bacterium]
MAWSLEGRYFENCSCDAICPCTWSGLTARATLDRCNFLLVMHIDKGDVEGVDVSNLTFALIGDTPPVMSDGDWRLGAFVDAAADDRQRQKLSALLGGELGGPLALLEPLVGENLGLAFEPITFEARDGRRTVRIGDGIDVTVEEFVAPGGPGAPARLENVFHPANTTLTVAPAVSSRIDGLGITFKGEGKSGFTAPFSWTA